MKFAISTLATLSLSLTAVACGAPSVSTSNEAPGAILQGNGQGPVVRPGSLGSARMFTTGDARPSPCDIGLAVELIRQDAKHEIAVESIVRDPEACANLGVRMHLNPNPRTYLVLEGDRTTDQWDAVHYLGRDDGNTFFSLVDYRDATISGPQFSRWVANENDTTYFADVVEDGETR